MTKSIKYDELATLLNENWQLDQNHQLPSRIFGPEEKNKQVIETLATFLKNKGFQVYIFNFDTILELDCCNNIFKLENNSSFSINASNITESLTVGKIIELLLLLDTNKDKKSFIYKLSNEINSTYQKDENIFKKLQILVNDLITQYMDQKLNQLVDRIIQLKHSSSANELIQKKIKLLEDISDFINEKDNKDNYVQYKLFKYQDFKNESTYNSLRIIQEQLEIINNQFSKDYFPITQGINIFDLNKFPPSLKLLFFLTFRQKLKLLKNNSYHDTYLILNINGNFTYDFSGFIQLDDLRRPLSSCLGLCMSSSNYKQFNHFTDANLDIFTKTYPEHKKNIHQEYHYSYDTFSMKDKLFIYLKHKH